MAKETQYDRILKALLNGDRISQLDAYSKYGRPITRLGAVILLIRQHGINVITSDKITNPNTGSSFCEYYMEQDEINRVKAWGIFGG